MGTAAWIFENPWLWVALGFPFLGLMLPIGGRPKEGKS
jgi:hypothetical protein